MNIIFDPLSATKIKTQKMTTTGGDTISLDNIELHNLSARNIPEQEGMSHGYLILRR